MSRDSKASDRQKSASGGVGTRLVANRYELQELMGRGSMGTVYCALDVVLDRPVAVKLFPTDATDAQQAARYEQEAKLLARLSHPGLVTVYDAGIDATVADEPRPYLVMELVRGPTLADRLKDGALPAAEVAVLATQLASALAHIHRRDVVHRDVKPANILLRPPEDGSPYPAATLTDFGIARLIDSTRITMTGYTLGTANYLSPEQLSGKEVGAASDIYSLGLVLLECLTGEIAYPGHGVEAALPRLQRAPVIPDSLPAGWPGLLRAMTDHDPANRPAASEIATHVGGAIDASPVPNPSALPVIDEAPTAMAMPVVDASVPVVDASVPGADASAPVAVPSLPVADASVPEADRTRVLPTVGAVPTVGTPPGGPGPRSRGLLRPSVILLAAVALIVVIFIVSYAASSGGDTPTVPGPVPVYPSVSGQIGDHLRQLQQDVQP
jgi:eukaryotic-like serine/threonine-protein kinase